jgi:hypothetical protein
VPETTYLYPLKPINSFTLEAEIAAVPLPVKGNGVGADQTNVRVSMKRELDAPEKTTLDGVVEAHVPPAPPVGAGIYRIAEAPPGPLGQKVRIAEPGSVKYGLVATYIIRGRLNAIDGGLLAATPVGTQNGLAAGWDIIVNADGSVDMIRTQGTAEGMYASFSFIWI